MTEQAAFEPAPGAFAPSAGTGPVEVDWVVPAQRRLAMPAQSLEPSSLRGLLGGPTSLKPAPVVSTRPAQNDR